MMSDRVDTRIDYRIVVLTEEGERAHIAIVKIQEDDPDQWGIVGRFYTITDAQRAIASYRQIHDSWLKR